MLDEPPEIIPADAVRQRIIESSWVAIRTGTRAEYQLAQLVLRLNGVSLEEIERQHLISWRSST